jgi:hypothetical protein
MIWLGDREQRGEDLEEHSCTAINLARRTRAACLGALSIRSTTALSSM